MTSAGSGDGDGSGRNRSTWMLVAILALGVVATVQALLVEPRMHRPIFYDEQRFGVYADNLRLHGFFGDEAGKFPATVEMRSVGYSAGVAPGYPFFLAGTRAVFGTGTRPIRIVQAIAAGAATVFTALLGWRLFGSVGGIVAGLAMIATGELAAYSQFGLSEVLATTFLAAAMFLVLVSFDRGSWPLMLGAGAVLGVSALFRPQALLLPIPLGAWALLSSRRGRALALALVGGTVIAVLPWTVRNHVRLHAIVPIASYAWGGAFLANNAHAGFIYAHPEDFIGVDEVRRIRSLPELAQEAAWRKLTLDWIRAHPGAALSGWIRNGWTFLTHIDDLMPRWYQIRMQTVPRLDERMLAPLALAGSIVAAAAGLFTRRTFLPAIVALYTIAFFCFFLPIPRYRIAMLPALCVLAAAIPAAMWALLNRLRPTTSATRG